MYIYIFFSFSIGFEEVRKLKMSSNWSLEGLCFPDEWIDRLTSEKQCVCLYVYIHLVIYKEYA